MTMIITTHEWGANESRNATPTTHPIGPTPGITLHWTGNGYGWPWTHSRCFELVRGIERSHEYGNGWGDIAYNLLPCPHGYIFEGRGLHVRSSANGNRVRNLARYAVCYLGGTGDEFTAAGADAMREAVRLLHEQGGARLDVNGHRDGWSTTCPGSAIYRWLNNTNWKALTASTTQKDWFTMADKDDLKQAVREVLDDPAYREYGGEGRARKLSHILLRTDLNTRRLLARDLPTAADIAAAIHDQGGSVDQATVEAGVTAVLARLLAEEA